MQCIAIFLDDGGVMNNNEIRGPQWRRLLGEFFPPRLGGTPNAWAETNREVASKLWDEYASPINYHETTDAAAWWYTYQVTWMRRMGEALGADLPDDDGCFELAEQAGLYVTHRVRSAFPGAVTAIRALDAAGYLLFTASGERSHELEGYLTGMGVRACFKRLYGPNLINTLKVSPAYYRRIFADAGVNPTDALVVDDSPKAVGWALAAGARAALVGNSTADVPDTVLRIDSLRQLPLALSRS